VPKTSEEAFEAFFREHQRDIFGYLWRLTGEEQAAHDLSQETFLRAWRQFARVRAYERPRAWLFRIATNLAIDHQRRRSSPTAAADRLSDALTVRTDPALHLAERDAVRAAMLQLPIRQRTALVLRVVYGMAIEEVATTLGVSNVVARMTLARAREQFRRRYAGEGGGER